MIPVVALTVAAKPAATVVPARALGIGVDGAEAGTADRVWKPEIVGGMRSMGHPALTYRLRTELGIEAWHWNPNGAWSDPNRRVGYFTGAATGARPISLSFGYRLPRRGSTVDQANNDGYSRLDDGDPTTFWKSNPYLDARFTGEPNDAHPQWIVVDLERPTRVDAIRLRWAEPYATRYRAEYFDGSAKTFDETFADGDWKPFPLGERAAGGGGVETIRLSGSPIPVRFVRLSLRESSGTAPAGSRDVRDGLGYALRELEVGRLTKGGRLIDAVRHARSRDEQSPIVASSCDPWHRESDRDPRVEQPGIDRVVRSGLSDRPMLTPVGVLYDTPENAAALARYVRSRNVPVSRIELGEEPDGQYATPEDYGALYVQCARAIHAVDPSFSLGGPSLQTAVEGWVHWPDANGDRSWMRRFVRYLQRRGALGDLGFFSFEWYPFDDLRPPAASQLLRHAALLDESLSRLEREGVPRFIPWIISEYGWSPYASREEVELPAALLNVELVTQFLERGGDSAYFYGAEPNVPILERETPGATWGNLTPFLAEADGRIVARLPAYWGAWLLSQRFFDGARPSEPHALYSVRPGDPALAAFATRRPDGSRALLLLNRDPRRARRVRLPFGAAATIWRYGPAQYRWRDAKGRGRPAFSFPPQRGAVADGVAEVPAFGMCVAVQPGEK